MTKNGHKAPTAVTEHAKILPSSWSTPAWTMEERLHRIEVLGQKISDYVRFMSQVAEQDGASREAKDRVVTAFYNRMVVVEKELALIQERFRLE